MKWGLTAEVQAVLGRYSVEMERYKGWKIKYKIGGDICCRLSQMEAGESDKFLDHIKEYLKP